MTNQPLHMHVRINAPDTKHHGREGYVDIGNTVDTGWEYGSVGPYNPSQLEPTGKPDKVLKHAKITRTGKGR